MQVGRKMEAFGDLLIPLTSCVCGFLILALLKLLHKYWWTPVQIQKLMSAQGIRGPPYKFIHGNEKENIRMRKEAMEKPMALTHEILPRVSPHTDLCIKTYGRPSIDLFQSLYVIH